MAAGRTRKRTTPGHWYWACRGSVWAQVV
ncbi:hypothetical protein [Pseudomonas fulva]